MWCCAVCIESPIYSTLNADVGQSVELSCNTSLTRDTMWTYDNNDDGYVDYIRWDGRRIYYIRWNGRRIVSDRSLFLNWITDKKHLLLITDAKQKHSGKYDCYNGTGIRNVGYHVNVTGR